MLMANRKIFVVFLFIFLLIMNKNTFADDNATSINTVFVATVPSSCYKLQSVKENKIYFVKDKNKKCIDMNTFIPVKVTGNYNSYAIFLDGSYYQSEQPMFDSKKMFDIEKNAKKLYKNIQTNNKYQKEMNIKAQETYAYYEKNVKPQVDQYQRELQTGMFSQYIPKELQTKSIFANNNTENTSKNLSGMQMIDLHLQSNEKLFICISSSIPNYIVRNYIKQTAELFGSQITFVLNGFIGGVTYISPTANYILGLLKKDQSCNPLNGDCNYYHVAFEIDPFVFSRFGITQVPAVVYVTDIKALNKNISIGWKPNAKVGNVYVYYGDISLGYALKEIGKASKNQYFIKAGKKLMSLNP